MDWQKIILQKDKKYYFKYREFVNLVIFNHTLITLISHSDNLSQLLIWPLSLVETAYQIVSMFKVVNKEARAVY